jgi:hypothetical protein
MDRFQVSGSRIGTSLPEFKCVKQSRVSLHGKTRMHLQAGVVNCVPYAVLLFMSAASSFSQSPDQLHTFFQQNIGLKDSEIADIDHGKAVAKILDSPTPSEVFVFGSVFIKAQPSAYVHMAADLDKLKSLPSYLAVGHFSSPPQLSDLAGFELDADDVNALKDCKPGNCEIQLPAENIEQVKSQIDWSAADPAGQVNTLAQKMALEALLAYQKGGNAALGTYRDKKSPAQVSEQFHALLSRSKVLPERLPAFYSYLLDYPKASLPDSSSVFYWEKVKFGLKPTLRMNQQIIARATGEHGPIDVVAIKQLYASHYFQTALDLYFCVPGNSQGFYLVTVKGSEQAGLTGVKGSTVRKVATDKTRSSLQKSLEAIKTQLEK